MLLIVFTTIGFVFGEPISLVFVEHRKHEKSQLGLTVPNWDFLCV